MGLFSSTHTQTSDQSNSRKFEKCLGYPRQALHYLSEETDFIFRAEAADILDREIRLAEELDLEKDEDEYKEYGQYSNVTPFWHPAK